MTEKEFIELVEYTLIELNRTFPMTSKYMKKIVHDFHSATCKHHMYFAIVNKKHEIGGYYEYFYLSPKNKKAEIYLGMYKTYRKLQNKDIWMETI